MNQEANTQLVFYLMLLVDKNFLKSIIKIIGIIGKSYLEAEIINVTIDITANHNGYFEFRLCKNDEKMKKVAQNCFDKNLLIVTDNNEKDAQKISDPSLNSKIPLNYSKFNL
jgi:hypothetical protein